MNVIYFYYSAVNRAIGAGKLFFRLATHESFITSSDVHPATLLNIHMKAASHGFVIAEVLLIEEGGEWTLGVLNMNEFVLVLPSSKEEAEQTKEEILKEIRNAQVRFSTLFRATSGSEEGVN
jgi:hypothetical protein